jgi:hypothetical protein
MWLLDQLLPFPKGGSADDYAVAQGAASKQSADEAELAIAAITCGAVAKEVAEHSRKKFEKENERLASITARAQALFFVAGLLSFFLTTGATLQSVLPWKSSYYAFILLFFCLATVLQIAILILNVSKAIEGINYLQPGSSDITRLAKLPSTLEFYKEEAILNLRFYRDASSKNSWRFSRLGNAIRALRNIIICICMLITCFFAGAAIQSFGKNCHDRTSLSIDGRTIHFDQSKCGAN